MRGQTGSVPEILVFPTEILVSGLEILPYEHLSAVTGMNSSNEFCVVLLCPRHFPHHKHPICDGDTAIRVAKAIIGAKVFEFRATTRLQPFLISEPG